LVLPYRPGQRILTVGDGDFSFSRALAEALSLPPAAAAEQSNGAPLLLPLCLALTATTYDTYAVVLDKYGAAAETALQGLAALGATALHGIDATQLHNFHDILKPCSYDRIVFQFPLAPPHTSRQEAEAAQSTGGVAVVNRLLLHDFLVSSSGLLRRNSRAQVRDRQTDRLTDN
jgi:25S rRNA (uracil2634-N3)-methyltransferase